MFESAYSIASANGFPFVCTNRGREVNGVWMSCFSKTADRTGPYMLIGLKSGRWVRAWVNQEVNR